MMLERSTPAPHKAAQKDRSGNVRTNESLLAAFAALREEAVPRACHELDAVIVNGQGVAALERINKLAEQIQNDLLRDRVDDRHPANDLNMIDISTNRGCQSAIGDGL